jgi:sugar phosphate isomerase/epimerase
MRWLPYKAVDGIGGFILNAMNNPFFTLDTAFYHSHGRYSVKVRAEMLRELGYAGTNASLWDDQAWSDLPVLVQSLDAHGLQLLGIWTSADVATGTFDPRLAEAIKLLAGRPAVIELALNSSSEHDKPSAPRADARAAELVHKVATLAAAAGLRVALYPHANSWLERVEDAVRLGMRVNRPEVGMTFNLYHWLYTDGTELEARLQLALPRMWNVTVNGTTRRGERDWTIEPLDQGKFDPFYFLGALARTGYAGPIALQGYGVGGDVYANLKRSITAYRDLTMRIVKHEAWSRLGPAR